MRSLLLVYAGGIYSVGGHLERALRARHHVVSVDSLWLGVRELRDPLRVRKRWGRLLEERATRPEDFDAAVFQVDHPRHHLPLGPFKDAGVPTANWFVDHHMFGRLPATLRMLREFDVVFTAEKGSLEPLRRAASRTLNVPRALTSKSRRGSSTRS